MQASTGPFPPVTDIPPLTDIWGVSDLDVDELEMAFHRVSGRVSLDLVATIGERWRRRFERLRTPADLDRWLGGAGLALGQRAPGGEMAPGRERLEPAAPADLEAVRRLRGAVEGLAVAAIECRRPSSAAVAVVNRAAGEADVVPQLAGGNLLRRPATQAAARALVARDAVELFGGPLVRRVRECAADDCALVFVDSSRPGTRRWCAMRACGNRRKAARHRQRQQQ